MYRGTFQRDCALLASVLFIVFFSFASFGREENYVKEDIKFSEDCLNVALNEKDYARTLAEKGDSHGAYVYAAYLSKGTQTYEVTSESLKWLEIAANKGHLLAQATLCDAYTRSGSQVGADQKEDLTLEEQLNWCFKAASHDSYSAKTTLAYNYFYGHFVQQGYQEAYYWSSLAGRDYPIKELAAAKLSAKDISEAEIRISGWVPQQPVIKQVNEDAVTQWKDEAYYRFSLPLNVPGLVCGGEAQQCRVETQCGDLVGIICKNEYLIANIKNKTQISSCREGQESCLDLVPDSWTCGSPRNMPLSKSDQKKFPQYKFAVSCGDILGVDHNSSGDGPYEFISKDTGDRLATCSFWQGDCQVPKGWICGRPSNYGG